MGGSPLKMHQSLFFSVPPAAMSRIVVFSKGFAFRPIIGCSEQMEKIIKDYLRGEEDQCLVQLITGERGSGKTTLLMKEMKWALDAIPNLKILFVCPVFKYESTGKYNWMLQLKYMKKITLSCSTSRHCARRFLTGTRTGKERATCGSFWRTVAAWAASS